MLSKVRVGAAGVLVALGIVVASCTAGGGEQAATTATDAPSTTISIPPNDGLLRNHLGYVFPEAPEATITGELAPQALTALDDLWETLATSIDNRAILDIGDSGEAGSPGGWPTYCAL